MSERDPRNKETPSRSGDDEETTPDPTTDDHDDKDEVDTASEESFPASDPPAY